MTLFNIYLRAMNQRVMAACAITRWKAFGNKYHYGSHFLLKMTLGRLAKAGRIPPYKCRKHLGVNVTMEVICC